MFKAVLKFPRLLIYFKGCRRETRTTCAAAMLRWCAQRVISPDSIQRVRYLKSWAKKTKDFTGSKSLLLQRRVLPARALLNNLRRDLAPVPRVRSALQDDRLPCLPLTETASPTVQGNRQRNRSNQASYPNPRNRTVGSIKN